MYDLGDGEGHLGPCGSGEVRECLRGVHTYSVILVELMLSLIVFDDDMSRRTKCGWKGDLSFLLHHFSRGFYHVNLRQGCWMRSNMVGHPIR